MTQPAPYVILHDEPCTEPHQTNDAPRIIARNYVDFLDHKFPERETILDPWLPSQGLAMVHGYRGVGKTHVMGGTLWATATGGGFLKWKAKQPRRVLLIDGEMPGEDLQARLRTIITASQLRPPEPGYWRVIAADDHRDGLPDLADPNAQHFYADKIADADVVGVDNISTLCRSYRENEADSWAPVQAWLLSLRRAGKSVVLAHHSGKSLAQRGSSKKEDILDTVIGLRKPPDYSPDQGARFEVHFEKSRGFYGPTAAPFEAWRTGEQWSINPIKSGDDTETLKVLHTQGLSIRDIAERTGLSKSTVQRRLDGADT